jgi:hypothetical protein
MTTATKPRKGTITTVRFAMRTPSDAAGKAATCDSDSASEFKTFLGSNTFNFLIGFAHCSVRVRGRRWMICVNQDV